MPNPRQHFAVGLTERMAEHPPGSALRLAAHRTRESGFPPRSAARWGGAVAR